MMTPGDRAFETLIDLMCFSRSCITGEHCHCIEKVGRVIRDAVEEERGNYIGAMADLDAALRMLWSHAGNKPEVRHWLDLNYDGFAERMQQQGVVEPKP